jgi:RNA exonuclease 4
VRFGFIRRALKHLVFEKQRLQSPVRMARDHALGAWGETSPAVMGSTENCDPLSSTSAPSRGSEKPELPPQPTCSHCYKRFKTAEQLTAHVAKANHSRHDPRCGACGKHFANLDTLRQHLVGQLPNKACAARFRASGCPLCLAIGAPGSSAHARKNACPFEIDPRSRAPARGGAPRAVALDCEMVGVEPDGGGAMCARVCVVDERGETLLSTFVKPSAPVTDYRTRLTGVDADNACSVFAGAPTVVEAREMVLEILNPRPKNDSTDGTNPAPPLVVGHDLAHDLACLGIDREAVVPDRRKRDTARYKPFQRHTHKPYKLRVLSKELLGLTIQDPNEAHDPREDAVAAMRLYLGGRALCRARHDESFSRTTNSKKLRGEMSESAPALSLDDDFLETTTTTRPPTAEENDTLLCAESQQNTQKPRFRCWCLDGSLDEVWETKAPRDKQKEAPSRAESRRAPTKTAEASPTGPGPEPRRALRDSTNAPSLAKESDDT